MADNVQVEVDPAVEAWMLEETDVPLERILEMIVEDAQRVVAVDTGKLKNSIRVLGVVDHVGRVGAGDSEDGTDEYAGVVEGVRPKPTPNYPYQPYLRPALFRVREGL